MGKKTVKTAEPTVAAAPAVVTEKPKKIAKTGDKSEKSSATREPDVRVVAPTFEEIQKQAYFVAERRLTNGLPGDSASDWIEAEKELSSPK